MFLSIISLTASVSRDTGLMIATLLYLPGEGRSRVGVGMSRSARGKCKSF